MEDLDFDLALVRTCVLKQNSPAPIVLKTYIEKQNISVGFLHQYSPFGSSRPFEDIIAPERDILLEFYYLVGEGQTIRFRYHDENHFYAALTAIEEWIIKIK